MPAFLTFLILALYSYRYRWVVPYFRPNYDSGLPMLSEFAIDAHVNSERTHLEITVYNFEPRTRDFTVAQASWNKAPLLGPLPNGVAVAPYSAKTWRLAPIDPRVADYGNGIEFQVTVEGGSWTSNSSQGGAPGLTTDSSGSIELTVFPGETEMPVEVRNIRVMNGKVTLAKMDGVHRIGPGGTMPVYKGLPPGGRQPTVTFEYRVTPWSIWESISY